MKLVALFITVFAACSAQIAVARDFGQLGTVFPVIEPDLLDTISKKLNTMQASGEIDRRNEVMKRRALISIEHPKGVGYLVTAGHDRSWLFDPTIVVQQTIKDASGRIVIPEGTRVNPLDHMPLHTTLIFVNGDDPAQVSYALKYPGDINSNRIILTGGAPLELMRLYHRRFYFDQGGALSRRFILSATPTVIIQEGHNLRMSEIGMLHHSAVRGG